MTTRVFVYGTLRKGHYNHAMMRDATFVANASTFGKMYSAGSFPMVSIENHDNHLVEGEIYEVSDELLQRLDDLESHPKWYVRTLVETTSGPAEMYVMPAARMYKGMREIPSGDWNLLKMHHFK